jgi:hypothetical protein
MDAPPPARYCVAENHRYFGRAQVNEMLRRKIYVADIYRTDDAGNRAIISVNGVEVKVNSNLYNVFQHLRSGDVLQMLVRGGTDSRRTWRDGVVYTGVVGGPASFRVVNMFNHRNAADFYSSPVVFGSRTTLERASNAGAQAGMKVEVQVPVTEWVRTDMLPYLAKHSTIYSA